MMDSLPTFVAVAEAESFSKVARAEGVAVSSVTRRIDALEAAFGTKLFNRSSRRVQLTDAGEQFLPRARALLADLADATANLGALGAEPHGVLTVTAPSAFGRRHVLPAVLSFLERYPRLEVDLDVTDRIVDLSARRVDVAVRIGALSGSDLVATPLAPLRRLVCASPAYLKRHGRPATPRDLLKHNCLTVASPPTPLGWWTFAGVNRNLPLAVKGTLRSDDTETLFRSALAGLGIAHLASWLVSDAIRDRQLVPLFPDEAPGLKTPPAIHAVRLPGRSDTAKSRLFIAHLREVFGEVPAWDRSIEKALTKRQFLRGQ